MDCHANIMIIQECRNWETETQGTLHQQQMYSDPTCLISKAKPLTCWMPNERCLGGEKVASLEEERCCWSSSVHEIIQTFFPSKGTVLSDSNLSGCPWHCEGWGTALRTCAIHMRIVWPRTWNRLWWRKIIPKQGTHKLFGPRLFKTKTNTATQVQ